MSGKRGRHLVGGHLGGVRECHWYHWRAFSAKSAEPDVAIHLRKAGKKRSATEKERHSKNAPKITRVLTTGCIRQLEENTAKREPWRSRCHGCEHTMKRRRTPVMGAQEVERHALAQTQ